MKKQNLIRTIVAMAFILSSAVYLTSCQKTVETQTFDDAFNTTNIQTLNDLMQNSSSIADLPEDFINVDLTVPEVLNNVQIVDLIASMEKNIKLSNSEIDLLLLNDIGTYSNMVARISSMPIKMEELNVTFAELESSLLSKYSLVQKQELDQYYIDDYYHSVLELQSYMKDFVIQPLRNLNGLVENTAALKSASTDKAKADKATSAVAAIILKNKKDMEDAYKKKCEEEKNKKHKGGGGNNGGGNNGWGNGDQTPPGNSGGNNNAENGGGTKK